MKFIKSYPCFIDIEIIMMRYNNVEFRQPGLVDSHGYKTDEDRPNEIIAWIYDDLWKNKETCYTICWLKADKEGYYMETVGNRYVEYEDMEALNTLTKYAMRTLNTQFEFEENK